jgi:hypothetical protein
MEKLSPLITGDGNCETGTLLTLLTVFAKEFLELVVVAGEGRVLVGSSWRQAQGIRKEEDEEKEAMTAMMVN